MGDDSELQILVAAELKVVRLYGLGKLDEFDRKTRKPKVPPTPRLEHAAKKVPGHSDSLTRSAAIESLLNHEIPLIRANPCREWLPLSFGLTDETRGKTSKERRSAALRAFGSNNRTQFERSDGGDEVNAIDVLAAQIIADCLKDVEASTYSNTLSAIPAPPPIIPPDRASFLRSTDGPDPLPPWSETLAGLGYNKEATQALVGERASDNGQPETASRQLYWLSFIQAEFYVPYFDTTLWSTMSDDGLAVAALSGGWRRGFKYIASDLFYPEFGYHELARVDRAKYAARQAKGNKDRARAALITFAERGCLAIPPGRTDLIATGINMYMKAVDKFSSRRYVHKSNKEHSELVAIFRNAARKGHRLDLIGRWENNEVIRMMLTIEENWNRHHDEVNWMQRRAAASHAFMLDALRTSTLDELQATHPLAMLQAARTIRFVLHYGTRSERIEVATYLLELQTGRQSAMTRASQEVLSLLMADLYQYGVRATGATQFADELASLVTRGTERQDLSGSDLLARSRVRQPRE